MRVWEGDIHLDARHHQSKTTKMKCPICNGTMQKVMKEDDGIPFETHKCEQCGEELLDIHQLKRLSKKYKQLRKAKEVTFSTWGNSLAVRIPKEYVKAYNITDGDKGMILKERKSLRIIPD